MLNDYLFKKNEKKSDSFARLEPPGPLASNPKDSLELPFYFPNPASLSRLSLSPRGFVHKNLVVQCMIIIHPSSSVFNPRSELAEFPADEILVLFDFSAVLLCLIGVKFDQKHQRHEHEGHDDQEPGPHGTGEAQGPRDDQASDPRE